MQDTAAELRHRGPTHTASGIFAPAFFGAGSSPPSSSEGAPSEGAQRTPRRHSRGHG